MEMFYLFIYLFSYLFLHLPTKVPLWFQVPSHQAFIYSKSIRETLEKNVKYFQSQQ